MQFVPILIILMTAIAINQVEGCAPPPPQWERFFDRIERRSGSPKLTGSRQDFYPSYRKMRPQNEKPDLGADVRRLIRDLGVLLNQ